MATIVASLDSVTFSYDGETTVIHGVSLQLEEGRAYALVGPNGAGKSTLVGIFCGLLDPTAGSVAINGYRNPGERRKHTACVAQQLSLFRHLSVAENLYLGLADIQVSATRTMKGVHEIADAALHAIGATIKPDVSCNCLPFPARQLVEIARAILRKPRVLFLDEPTSALDTVSRRRLYDVLRRINAVGVTVVLVSHDVSEIEAIGATPIYIRDGRLISEAPLVSASLPRDHDQLPRAPTNDYEGVVDIAIEDRWRAKRTRLALAPGDVAILSFEDAVERTDAVGTFLSKSITNVAQIRRPLCDWEDLPSPSSNGTIQVLTIDKQNDRLFPGLSVLDNLALLSAQNGAFAFRRAAHDIRILAHVARDAALVYSGPTATLQTLSGGNQQRFLVASLVERNPALLIMEEPLLGVDEPSRARILHCIGRYLEHGGRLVIATCFPTVYRSLRPHRVDVVQPAFIEF